MSDDELKHPDQPEERDKPASPPPPPPYGPPAGQHPATPPPPPPQPYGPPPGQRTPPPPPGPYGPPPGQIPGAPPPPYGAPPPPPYGQQPPYGPPGQYGPPPGYGAPRRPAFELGRVAAGVQRSLNTLGIDLNMAIKALVLALVSGLVAGLLGLLSEDFAVFLGGFAVALNGFTYAYFAGRETIAGLISGVLAGFFAGVFWYIMASLVSDTWPLNFGQTMLLGLLLGAASFGWYALLRLLPANILPGPRTGP